MIKTKELKRQLEEAQIEYNQAFQDAPLDMDYNQYHRYFDPYTKKVEELSQKVRLLEQDYSMREIPKYGDLMTLNEFKESCEDALFIDYDGSGKYATKTQMSTIPVYPSDVTKGILREDFTHVVWFNK